MPQYSYRAISNDSVVTNGVIVAESENLLERRIAEMGLWLVEAKVRTSKRSNSVGGAVTRAELIDFFSSLATLVDAGIDLAESMKVIASETVSSGLRPVLDDIRLNIESGSSVFEAMSAHPRQFSPEICNLVRAGEHSGNLVEACADISDHLEWVEQIMGDIKQATIYPAMISIAVLGLVFLMFSFVVPQFATIFDSLNLDLPPLTKGVVLIGEICNDYWWLILACIAGAYLFFRWAPGYWPEFAMLLDRLKIEMPIFGPVNHLLLLSRFTHNLALLLKAGVPIVQSIELVSNVVDNRVMVAALVHAQQSVVDGRRMSEALGEHKIVNPIVMRMIIVGEETGRLDSCLEKISSRMDKEIPRRIKRLFSILEPMIILFLLGVVGLVAASIFMPLFSLMSGIGG